MLNFRTKITKIQNDKYGFRLATKAEFKEAFDEFDKVSMEAHMELN